MISRLFDFLSLSDAPGSSPRSDNGVQVQVKTERVGDSQESVDVSTVGVDQQVSKTTSDR